MAIVTNKTTAMAATAAKTEPVFIKGDKNFRIKISATFAGTILLLRRPDNINASQANALVHSGAANASALTAAMTGVVADELIGTYVKNITDNSFGLITDNTTAVITATLAGGTENDWDIGDLGELWDIVESYTTGQDLIGYEVVGAYYMLFMSARTSGTARGVIEAVR